MTPAFMLLHDFAAILISWVLRTHITIRSKLCWGLLSRPNTACLLVEGRVVEVLKDTGSDRSCIDLGKAVELGPQLSRATHAHAHARFCLPNGREIYSMATTYASCYNSDDNIKYRFWGHFFVFQSLQVPVLLGNDLLDDAGEIRPYGARTLTIQALSTCGKVRLLHAMLDTGADCNVISMAALKSLGHKPDSNKATELYMATGKVIKSVGQVTLGFRLPCSGKSRCAEFQVFEKLEVPVMLGAEFMGHLSKFDRLAPRFAECDDSALRVTHLSRKGHVAARHFRCLINGEMVQASADTGSDLSLVSPLAASRLSGTSSIRTEDFDITLADGSKAPISASFRAPLSPYSAPTETVTERFHILEGVTADVFLGWHILRKIGAFTRNQKSFSDSTEDTGLYNLNVAALLSKSPARLLGMFRPSRRTRTKTDASSKRPSLQSLPSPSTPDGDFYAALKVVAAYETHLREKARAEIAGLGGIQLTIAEDAEKRRIERYEADLKSRLDERNSAGNNAS